MWFNPTLPLFYSFLLMIKVGERLEDIMKEKYSRKKLTDEEYKRRIYDLYGDDISVLEPYVNQRTKILHRCNIHNFEWMGRTRQMAEGHNGCIYCSSEKRSQGLTQNIEKVKEKLKRVCGDEFTLNDDNEYLGHNEKMYFTHHLSNGTSHTVYSKPDRIYNHKCPVCSGLQVCVGFNDIWTTNPDLGNLLANPDDGFKYMQNSNKHTDFKCPVCGYICKDKSINQVNRDMDVRCPICKDGISYPNKFIFNSLLQIKDKLDFLDREYRPKWCKFELKEKIRTGVYDIYLGINNKEYIIEMDGGFHEKLHSKEKYYTLEDIKYIDSMKDKLAIEHNIEMIRIDCSYDYHDRYKYILRNILNSKLSEILPLELIDFEEANIKSQKSLLVEACNLWNNGYAAHEIMLELNIGKWLVSSYLKQGQKYNLCNNYSAQNSTIRSSGTKVTCVNTGISYSTIAEPSKIYNIDDKGILNCCRGNDFSAGKDLNTGEKLFWMYTDDYNKLNKREVIKYLIDKKVKEYTENISGKAVYCTTTNEVFNSIMDAVRAYGGNESGIRKCCRGEIKTSGTLRNGTRLTWVFLKDYVEINNMTMEEFVIQHHYSSFLLE